MILVVIGAGGVGKGTVVQRLVAADPSLWLSRSWTTRTRRPGEPADAYVFVDRDTFTAHAEQGGFLEWAEFPGNGHLYGTPVPEMPDGRDLVLEIDPQGAAQVKALHPESVVVLLLPPSREEQEERLRRRGDSDELVARRLEVSAAEEETGRGLADHTVVNGTLDEAVAEVARILEAHRQRLPTDDSENPDG
ncbi:MAG TPA: guanylate kinase [Acidimicrobiales bacterium]|nr:guanylate kinase [Acidimicrobiales bacterium]